MPFIQAGDLTVHYDITGPVDAQPLVFVNSLGTNFHMWDAQLAAFARDYRVVRYDMRGHGMTEGGPAGDYTMATLAADLEALLDALQIAHAHVVGLSIGGMVGQQFAAHAATRVDALVLCATAGKIGTADVWDARIATVEAEGMPALVPAITARWFTPATHAHRPELIRGFSTLLERTSAAGYAGCCRALRDADLFAADAGITAPTLVVSGAEDPVTPPADGRALQAAIPGAEMAVLEGAAHILCIEQAAEFNERVLGFLAMHAQAAAVHA